jgi:hypothetical protein
VDYTGIGIKFAGQNQDGFPGRTKFFAFSFTAFIRAFIQRSALSQKRARAILA